MSGIGLYRYNALVIHGYIKCGVPEGVMKKTVFYHSMSYQIGNYQYSLDDIEVIIIPKYYLSYIHIH